MNENLKRKKIAINLLFLYEITGIGVYVKNLLENFGKIDKEDIFLVFTGQNPPKEIFFEYKNFRYIKLPVDSRSKIQRAFAEQFLLPFYLIKHKCDILFNPSIFNPLFVTCKKVTTIHDLIQLQTKRSFLENLYWRFLVFSALESKKVITVSQFSKNEILKFFPKASSLVKVIYHGVPKLPEIDAKTKNKVLQKIGNDKYFFYVGLIVPHKNIDNMLRAFQIFSLRHPTIKFVISGREVKPLIEIEKIIEKLELKDKVILTGPITEKEKVAFYKNSLALIFLSLHEGFGFPILEAQSLGVPVLASNIAALPEIGGEGCLYVNPNEIEKIAKAMEEIAFNSVLRNELIRKGFENIKKFSWEKTTKETLQVLKNYENSSS